MPGSAHPLRPRRLLAAAVLGVVGVGLAACAEVPRDLDEVRRSAEEGADRLRSVAEDLRNGADAEQLDDERFCLALTRALTAIESGTDGPAREAAEELLARSPEQVRDEAAELVSELRARRDDGSAVTEDAVVEAGERLRREAEAVCRG